MNDATPRCAVPGSACRLLQLETPGTRPVWTVLDAAGARHFTGEIVLLTDPQVIVHFDKGEAYTAERQGDPSIASRLVALGVLTPEQLDQGVVRLGQVEHLGRLFDRVPELDRHQVELALEVITAEVLGEIADHPVDEIRVASYRHHPSGVHRWLQRPVFVVASLGPDTADDVVPTPLDDRSGDRHVATVGDIALVEEYERLLADVPPVDQYAPTMALPVVAPDTASSDQVEALAAAEPVDAGWDASAATATVAEPEPEPDTADWAVEAAVAWPDDLVAPEPAPEPELERDGTASDSGAAANVLDEPVGVFGEPTIIWDLPIDGESPAPATASAEPTPVVEPTPAPVASAPATSAPELAGTTLDVPAESAATEAASGGGGLEMPSFDVASIMQQMARGDDGTGSSLPLLPDLPEVEVDDDVKAAVRAALAEIEAATRGEISSSPEPSGLPAFATELGVDGRPPAAAFTTPAHQPARAETLPIETPAAQTPAVETPTPVLQMPYLPDRRATAAEATEPDPIGAAIASVAAELPGALDAPDDLAPLDAVADDAPKPSEQPTGGLRRLIGIRKP